MEFTMKLRKHSRSKTTSRSVSLPVKSKQNKKKPTNKPKKCICLPSLASHADFPVIWNELRNNMQLCDGLVKCEDKQEFKVHRAILSAVSPFFKVLFLNTLNRGQPEITEVAIKVPGNVFSLILDYAYSGQCNVNSDNVQSLLTYADQLEVLGIVRVCCQYIIDHLDPSNCLEVLLFARQYFCRDLEERGRRYIRHHFRQVMDLNPDYYELNADELLEILSDDELNAKSEQMVFEAIKLWVEYDVENRKMDIFKLLPCVRLGLIPCHYYTGTILKWNLVQDNSCGHVVERHDGVPTRPRVPYEVMFAVGGWSAGSPTSFIETYDSRADRWLLCVNTDVTPRAYHGLCTLDGLIYMIGGFDGNEHFNTMRSFNPVTREWREHACMYYPRCYVSVAMHDGKIYAMGGYNGRSRMNSAERYDPETNQWELIASMHRQRSDASAAVLQNKIYIVGGFNGTEVLRSAEMYDPTMNQWSFVSPMSDARSGVSLLAFRDALYAFGGFNGYSRLSSAEKYTADRAEWVYIPEMLNPRSNFASVVLDQMVFVIGGFNGSTTIANVEYLDVNRNEWFEVNAMNLNRSALSACVLAGLPNAREYSFMYKHNQNLGMPEAS